MPWAPPRASGCSASGCLQDARTSETAVDVLNAYLFDELQFVGNRAGTTIRATVS